MTTYDHQVLVVGNEVVMFDKNIINKPPYYIPRYAVGQVKSGSGVISTCDGTDPNSSIGKIAQLGNEIRIYGEQEINDTKFISTSTNETTTLFFEFSNGED